MKPLYLHVRARISLRRPENKADRSEPPASVQRGARHHDGGMRARLRVVAAIDSVARRDST
jgi:hypothetical protein